jgi:hypothetical protein
VARCSDAIVEVVKRTWLWRRRHWPDCRQSILGNPSILGVIGTTCSRTAVTAMQVLGPAHVVMVSPSNTAPGLTNPDHEQYGGEFFFRTAYNDKVQGAAVAKYACEELKIKKAATFHDGSPYAEQLQQVFADEFVAQCGGTITSQNAIAVGDVEFHNALTTISADAPDMIFMPIFDPEVRSSSTSRVTSRPWPTPSSSAPMASRTLASSRLAARLRKRSGCTSPVLTSTSAPSTPTISSLASALEGPRSLRPPTTRMRTTPTTSSWMRLRRLGWAMTRSGTSYFSKDGIHSTSQA